MDYVNCILHIVTIPLHFQKLPYYHNSLSHKLRVLPTCRLPKQTSLSVHSLGVGKSTWPAGQNPEQAVCQIPAGFVWGLPFSCSRDLQNGFHALQARQKLSREIIWWSRSLLHHELLGVVMRIVFTVAIVFVEVKAYFNHISSDVRLPW